MNVIHAIRNEILCKVYAFVLEIIKYYEYKKVA